MTPASSCERLWYPSSAPLTRSADPAPMLSGVAVERMDDDIAIERRLDQRAVTRAEHAPQRHDEVGRADEVRKRGQWSANTPANCCGFCVSGTIDFASSVLAQCSLAGKVALSLPTSSVAAAASPYLCS